MQPPLPTPPPWEAVLLLSHCLDPKTLALASCVSRSWNAAMSSDHLWRPFCHSHFPSLSSLLRDATTSPPPPYRALFAILRNASERRRLRDPPPPRLALRQLVFAVDVFQGDALVFSAVKSSGALGCAGESAIFRFEMGAGEAAEVEVEQVAPLRAVWAVVGEGREVGAAVLMDCAGKGRVMGGGNEVWFSEELPPPACCSGCTASGLVAEMGLGLGSRCGGTGDGEVRGRRRRVVRASVGLMSVVSWRYVGLDDGLRYLQHFFSC